MPSMALGVLLPFEVFAVETEVARAVVDTRQSVFALLPQPLSCVLALVPGVCVCVCVSSLPRKARCSWGWKRVCWSRPAPPWWSRLAVRSTAAIRLG